MSTPYDTYYSTYLSLFSFFVVLGWSRKKTAKAIIQANTYVGRRSADLCFSVRVSLILGRLPARHEARSAVNRHTDIHIPVPVFVYEYEYPVHTAVPHSYDVRKPYGYVLTSGTTSNTNTILLL